MITEANAEPWMARRKCSDSDPELWYAHALRGSQGDAGLRAAVTICNSCPVRAECLRFALDTNDVWAILGGTTPQQRRRMKRATS